MNKLVIYFLFSIYIISCICKENENIRIKIDGKLLFPKDRKLSVGTKIILNGGEYTTFPKLDGTFVLNDLGHGGYYLEVISEYEFVPVRINISRSGHIKARLADERKTSKSNASPLLLEAVELKNYFEEREVYNWKSLLSNPMAIMVIITMVMALVIPKMMDPEMMKELQTNNDGQPIGSPSEIFSKLLSGDNGNANANQSN